MAPSMMTIAETITEPCTALHDSHRGYPQHVTASNTQVGAVRRGLHAPPLCRPQQLCDLSGSPPPPKWKLFAYNFASTDLAGELGFVINHLWLERTASKDSR